MSDEELKQARLHLASELKRARKAAGMTQQDLASALSVNQTTVARWETGERSMSTDKLGAISKVLGVRVLILREEEAQALQMLRGIKSTP